MATTVTKVSKDKDQKDEMKEEISPSKRSDTSSKEEYKDDDNDTNELLKQFLKESELFKSHWNSTLFNEKEKQTIKLLIKLDQTILIKKWDKLGVNDKKKKEFLAQIEKLDSQYPTGLSTYWNNAKRLLKQSQFNINSYKGWDATVPKGVALDFDSKEFNDYEREGQLQFDKVGFVLLNGGFGERLGYKGLKTELPIEITTMTSYMGYYIKTALAFQEHARIRTKNNKIKVPFAMTTSGYGHGLTLKLLKENNYFGMDKEQVFILPQELVASFSNNRCEFATDFSDKYKIVEKPHGHGDVHSLMFQYNVPEKWLKMGIKYGIFIQDTNGIAMRSIPSALGVSSKKKWLFNSITVPKKIGEKFGGICELNNKLTKKINNKC